MGQIQQLHRITIWGVGLIGGSLGARLEKERISGTTRRIRTEHRET